MEQRTKRSRRFDFHVHTKLSRSIPFKMADIHLLIEQAKHMGLDGFAITEHINAPDYWEVYRQIGRKFSCRFGVYEVEPGFHIINGAEITLDGRGDVLALGDIRLVLDLDRRLNLHGGYHPTLEQLVGEAGPDLILIGAHPFRPDGGIMKFDPAAIRQLAALEINGKDFGQEHRVQSAANAFGLPVIGGSDTHYWPQVGIRRTVLPISTVSIEAIRNAVSSGSTTVECDLNGPLTVQMCQHHKAAVKTALGLYSHRPDKLMRSLEKEVLGERQERACIR